jgi:hypothetical protein
VTVNSVNDLPFISPIPDQLIQQDTTAAIDFIISDVETPASNLVVSVVTSDPMLVPQTGLILSGTGSNRSLTIAPAPGAFGKAVVILTLTDADGGQATSSFVLSLSQTSFPPVIIAQPQGQTVPAGASMSLSVSASLGDITALDLQPLSYQWEHNGQPLPGQTNSTFQLENVTTADAGEYTVLITSCCGAISSDPAWVRVLASPTLLSIVQTNGVANIRFTTLPGLNYAVEFNNSLNDTNWILLDFRTGTGSTVELQDFGAKIPMRFYRVRVE